MVMKKVIVYMDNREDRSLDQYFSQYDCSLQRKMLVCGDFLVSDRVCIERKTISDFIQSIVDGRLFQQLKLMKDNFEKPLLIIEGSDHGTLYERLHPNTIRGALAAISLDMGMPIIWTNDFADTVGMVYWIARREQLQLKREVPIRIKQKAKTPKEQQEFLVAGLPDISVIRAKSLLKHLKTPLAIFNASEKELQEVDGIGKKIAKNIRKILEKQYKGK